MNGLGGYRKAWQPTPPRATANCCNGFDERGIAPYIRVKECPMPTTDLYGIDKFTKLPEENCYVCPEGKRLTYVGINQRNRVHLFASTLKRCRDCSQKPQCTRGKYRTLAIHVCEPARQRAHALAQTPEFAISQRARRKVEALFAELKNQIGLRRLRLCAGCGSYASSSTWRPRRRT
jgi:hypothetical protein